MRCSQNVRPRVSRKALRAFGVAGLGFVGQESYPVMLLFASRERLLGELMHG